MVRTNKKNDAKIKSNWKKEGSAEGMAEGITQGIILVVKNMLEHKMDVESIMEYTNVKREEIEKIKKEINNKSVKKIFPTNKKFDIIHKN